MPAANVVPQSSMSAEEAAATPLKPAYIQQRVHDMARAPSAERLAAPHQRISLRNTSEQCHWFTDRQCRGVEIRPGQTVELDMLTDEIEHHMRLLREDRGFYESGPNKGKAFPSHPCKIVGMAPKQGGAALV